MWFEPYKNMNHWYCDTLKMNRTTCAICGESSTTFTDNSTSSGGANQILSVTEHNNNQLMMHD